MLAVSTALARGGLAKTDSGGPIDADTSEVVELGGSELLGGLPGEGPLTLDELKAWLDRPENHVKLRPRLPLGLAAGAAQTAGIEANPLTRAKIELGRQLFFDTRLSADGTVSCASCHDPGHGYSADTRFGVGVRGQLGDRNSPPAYNRILSAAQFRDGRAKSLEEQAVGPIQNPIEMASTHPDCVATLRANPGYALQFERVFADGVTIENVGRAIATFERTLVTGPAPWDYQALLNRFEKAYAEDLEDLDYLEQDDPELFDSYKRLRTQARARPMTEAAQRGAALFFSQRVGCSQCHVGANFTDELYHNVGVGMEAEAPDLGRFKVTGEDSDRGAFKTPTLRNVALTAPYMHDGSQKTLQEVVDWYDVGGHPNPQLSDKIRPIGLETQERDDLVEFLRALTGTLPRVQTGRLPGG